MPAKLLKMLSVVVGIVHYKGGGVANLGNTSFFWHEALWNDIKQHKQKKNLDESL